MTENDKLLDRMLTEIDKQAKFLEEIAKITYQTAALLPFITRIILALFLFITITALSTIYINLENHGTKTVHSQTLSGEESDAN